MEICIVVSDNGNLKGSLKSYHTVVRCVPVMFLILSFQKTSKGQVHKVFIKFRMETLEPNSFCLTLSL